MSTKTDKNKNVTGAMGAPGLFENRIESIAFNHHVFNEKEAAFYCRCSVDSIRYHALRSRKLTFLKKA